MLLVTALTIVGGLFAGASPAFAGLGVSVVPTFPTPVTVGQRTLDASLTLENNSTMPDNAAPIQVSDIRLTPSCGTEFSLGTPNNDCPALNADPGVFALSATGTGTVGTACAGQAFTISQPSANTGQVTFTPVGATFITLQVPNARGANGELLDTCQIDFTIDVLRRPDANHDSKQQAGIQTQQFASADVRATANANVTIDSPGTSFVTINQAVLNVTTSAAVDPAIVPPVATTFRDQATLVRTPATAPSPTGVLTFTAYGPDDADCSGARDTAPNPAQPPQVRTAPINGQSVVSSPAFSPTQGPGTYHFVVSYIGDANFSGFSTACNAANESVLIPGPQIHIEKTVAPLQMYEPGGTFTYTLVVTNPGPVDIVNITSLMDDKYGDVGTNPDPANTCDDLIGKPLPKPVNGVVGPGLTCSFPGVFMGVAGDAKTNVATVRGVDINNFPATDDDTAIATLIPKPQIKIDKTASPLSLPVPGGTFTYTLVVTNPGPIDITITSLTDDKYGNIGTDPAPSNTCDDLIGKNLPKPVNGVVGPGLTCSFQGVFMGPAGAVKTNVATVIGTDVNGNTATDNNDAVVTITALPVPQIKIDKTASPLSLPEPGGTFTYTLVVTNPGPIDITITSLTDDKFGNVGTDPSPSNTCDDLIGKNLPKPVNGVVGPGLTCSFQQAFMGVAGAVKTNVATVIGTDVNGNTATDNNDAVVALVPKPVIAVVKTASPLSLPAPGGTFTFSLVVSNPGPVSIRITELTDNVYGNIGTSTAAANTCDDLIGRTLAPGASATCSFEGNFAGASGAAQTDIVTVKGVDNNGNPVTANDDAIVTLTPGPAPPPPPPPPPPPAGVAPASEVVRGTARVSGPTGCVPRKFNVVVAGRQIQRVIFTMDGKVVRTLYRPNSGIRFKLPVDPGTLRNGTHRVLARIIFRKASGTSSRTLRVTFSRCARKAALPKFTG